MSQMQPPSMPGTYAPPPAGPPVFYKNPSVAAILSFFWAGLGQIYNGQIGKGIAFIVLYALCALSMYIVIGFVTTPILWIIGMVDAYSSANKINAKFAQQQQSQQMWR